MHSAALQRLLFYFKKIGPFANKDLLARIQKVSKDDLLRVMKQYVLALFEQKDNIFVTTNPSKIEEIQHAFAKLGVVIKVKEI